MAKPTVAETMDEKLPQGWGWPGNSQKAHYFMRGSLRSLCGRWLYTGTRTDTLHGSPDNCAECRRRHAKLYPKATEGAKS